VTALDHGFWSGKRVLVTGHTGFKGAWLSLWLQAAGARVGGFSRGSPSAPALYDVAGIGPAMASETAGDVRDLAAVDAAFAAARPEIVVHLAAQPLVRRSYAEPVATYATNVMGTVNVLDAARRAGGVRAIVVVTSDKAYENREWEWGYREDEPMGGHDPYSNSKGCAELVTAAYRRSFFEPGGVQVATARAGNVIGGGDWAQDRLIPDLVRGALEGRTVVVRNPGAVRPWQHVLNPLGGYLTLAERLWDSPGFAGGWNFGPDAAEARPVGWIADHLRELWGPELTWEARPEPGAVHEALHVKLDSSKARQRLGWQPAWTLPDGLRAVVEWSRAFASGAAMRGVGLAQIDAYEGAR
jgi:CDP-glucose 4,6-dehydratase